MTEMKSVLKAIARRTRQAPANNADEKLQRRRVLFIPSEGAKAILTERTPAPVTAPAADAQAS
jgi:hypothetical protein